MAASRIDDLRRRVDADPASIAFAQLAEEYRRAGQSEEAVRVCREGLTRHPVYLSARVTLGRALLDLGDFEAAREELEFVAREAPENLAAVRGLAEILHREGALRDALEYYKRALALARHDPELEEIVQQLSRQVGAEDAPTAELSFEEAHEELLAAGERVPLVAPAVEPASATPTGATAPFDFDKLVSALGSPAGPVVVPPAEAADLHATRLVPDLVDAVAGLTDSSVSSDPFGALEAELRARDEAPPVPGGLLAEGAPEEPDAHVADHVEPALPEMPETPAVEPAAEAVAEVQPSQLAEDVVTPPTVPDELPTFAEMIEPSQAEPLPWVDPDAEQAPRPWPWEPVAVEEVATAEFFEAPEPPAAEVLPVLQDGPAGVVAAVEPVESAMTEAHVMDELDAASAGLDTREAPASPEASESPGAAEMAETPEVPEAPGAVDAMAQPGVPDTVEAAAESDHLETAEVGAVALAADSSVHEVSPEPAAAQPLEPAAAEDDVLGDLEGWLETLQARSGQH